MITITKDIGDVMFLNEREFVRIDFNKSDRRVVAHLIQHTPHIGSLYSNIEVNDVQSIAYTNEAQPTSLIFETKDLKLSETENDVKLDDAPFLSTGAISILNYFGLNTIGQVMKLRRESIRALAGIGPKSLSAIRDYLEDHGAGWGQNYLIAFYKKAGGWYEFSHFELTKDTHEQTWPIPKSFHEGERSYYEHLGSKIIE